MEKISHKVGDTVTIIVDVPNIEKNHVAKFFLYSRYSSDGLKDLIKEILPAKEVLEEGKIIFSYNTNDFCKKPMVYYGHFYLDNNGIILNNYYKIRAHY